MSNFTLKIVSIVYETEDAITISFKQPALKKVKYICGQYLTLVLNINGRKFRRPYSIASTPGVDSTVDITIKRIPHGIVSNYLNDAVKEGDLIEVMEPLGDFIFPKHEINIGHLFLWGAGSGITPLYSILKSALNLNAHLNISLVYASKNIKNTIYYEKLIEIQKKNPDRFRLIFYFSQEVNRESGLNAKRQRISTSDIQAIIRENEYLHAHHYICGPEQLKKTIKDEILGNNSETHHVFSEDFVHIVNEEELANIHTQHVKIKLNDVDHIIEVVRGKSILEAGLDRGLDMPYSCQNGTCHLCKAKLNTGKIKLIGVDSDAGALIENEYLLCCGYPLSNDVEIELNN